MPLPEIIDNTTPAQITKILSDYWGLRNDSELSREIGVERGSIAQYKNRKTIDIQTKIIRLIMCFGVLAEQQ